MSERITDVEVLRIATLSRLRLSQDEVGVFRGELDAILEHMRSLDDVDTTNIQPTTHPTTGADSLREDAARQTLTRDDVLANAPECERGQFRVPRVVEGGN